jgi:hypothetical protein
MNSNRERAREHWNSLTPAERQAISAETEYQDELRRVSDRTGYSMESLDRGVQQSARQGTRGTKADLLRISEEAHKLEERLRPR